MVYKISDNILSPLGDTTEQNFRAVAAGHSALTTYNGHWQLPEPFCASLLSGVQRQNIFMEGFTQYEQMVIASVRRAIDNSSVDVTADRVVLILATTKGNIELLSDKDACPEAELPGMSAMKISRFLGFTTKPIVVCNACVSGLSAVIIAKRLLESGHYDQAVVCGADIIGRFVVSGFQSLKAVSAEQCRPFDLERTGLNLGESAATIILSRTAPQCKSVWAIETGVVRNDAYHISSPSKNAEGAYKAISAAMDGLSADSLAFINAHGTATMFNDQMESVAIERAALNTVPVNAYKGYFGHTLGAAGVLETLLSMKAIENNVILPTRGFDDCGVSGKIKVVKDCLNTNKVAFLKMISGFGGCNAVVSARCYNTTFVQHSDDNPPAASAFRISHRVTVTVNEVTVDGRKIDIEGTGSRMLTSLYKKYGLDYPKFYKMDTLCRLGFIASELLLEAEGGDRFRGRDDRAVILFNRSSSIISDRKYLETIAADNFYPSPSVFVYTLPNIVTGEIAMRNSYYGETAFYILPERDEQQMGMLVEASFLDQSTRSMITGWIDCTDDNNFVADIYITETL